MRALDASERFDDNSNMVNKYFPADMFLRQSEDAVPRLYVDLPRRKRLLVMRLALR